MLLLLYRKEREDDDGSVGTVERVISSLSISCWLDIVSYGGGSTILIGFRPSLARVIRVWLECVDRVVDFEESFSSPTLFPSCQTSPATARLAKASQLRWEGISNIKREKERKKRLPFDWHARRPFAFVCRRFGFGFVISYISFLELYTFGWRVPVPVPDCD